MGRRDP
ncbi:hypothetical protein LINPERPRIM_LOCUS29401 [Linum perenne]